jgi:Tfp pilus assembly PilM family ATPase
MGRKGTVVGIDFGQYAVKAVWAERRGNAPAVTRMESLRLPTDRFDSGNIIGPWFEKMGITRVPCVIGLPGAQSIFQPLFLPPEDLRTFEQATAMEVIKFNEMASETMVYGFTSISINPGERRLILSMARPSVLDEALNRARNLGLDVIDIVPTPVATFNALDACAEDTPTPSLYINIGYSGTEVCIGSRTGLLFARAFAGGGQMFTDALAKAGNTTVAQSENRKLADGSLLKGAESSAVLSKVADLWLAEVQSCLSVHRSLFSDRRAQPTRVVMAGGGAELRGLADHIAPKLGIPVTVAENLPGNPPAPKAPHFVAAAGLAACGLNTATSLLSLLPPDLRDEMTFRRQKAFWIAAGLAAVLILAVSILGGFRYSTRMQKHLRVQESSLAVRQQLASEIDSAKARSDLIMAMATPVRNLLSAGPTMRNLITLTAESKAPGDSIIMISDADSYFSRQWTAPSPAARGMRDRRRAAPPPTAANIATSGLQRVIIEGFTRTSDLSTVKELITKLSASGLVESADLLSDDKLVSELTEEGMPVSQRFVIDITMATR